MDQQQIPVLVSFADSNYASNKSLDFVEFGKSSANAAKNGNAQEDSRIIVAETGLIELIGESLAGQKPQAATRYVVAVRKKGANKLALCECEPVRVNTVIKKLKNFGGSQIGKKSMVARNTLGETFGTIKRKQAIRATERNKVNVSAMDDVQNVLSKTLDQTTSAMTSQDIMNADQNANRPIPPFNLAAKSPAEVYNINDIVPDAKTQDFPIHELLTLKQKKDLQQALAGLDVKSWVFERIFLFLQHRSITGLADTRRLRQLVYLAVMMKFWSMKESALNKEDVMFKQFPGVPSEVLDDLMMKFTTLHQDGNTQRRKMIEESRDRMLGYILCLALLLNDYNMDVNHFAADMTLPVSKISTMCKELGCKVDDRTSDGQKRKVATLVVPLKFPMRRR